jgi:4-hydroxy-2-oxoheptanedioate aldolase
MNAFKQMLRNRETCSLVNVDHASPSLVQFLARTGVDAVMFDCEQGNPSFEDVENMSRAARLHKVPAVVRIPSAEPWTIERYVMRGIDGIVVPRLDTAAQVARAVADIRYAAPRDFDATAVLVQIESVSAVRELEGFLAIPEIDCFFIGAVDLSKSMGFAGDYGNLEVLQEIDGVIETILQAGRCVGCLVKEHDLQTWHAKGATMLYTHVNDFIAMGARQWHDMAHIHPR